MFVQRFHTVHAPFIKHNKLAAAQSVGNRGPCDRGMDGVPSAKKLAGYILYRFNGPAESYYQPLIIW